MLREAIPKRFQLVTCTECSTPAPNGGTPICPDMRRVYGCLCRMCSRWICDECRDTKTWVMFTMDRSSPATKTCSWCVEGMVPNSPGPARILYRELEEGIPEEEKINRVGMYRRGGWPVGMYPNVWVHNPDSWSHRFTGLSHAMSLVRFEPFRGYCTSLVSSFSYPCYFCSDRVFGGSSPLQRKDPGSWGAVAICRTCDSKSVEEKEKIHKTQLKFKRLYWWKDDQWESVRKILEKKRFRENSSLGVEDWERLESFMKEGEEEDEDGKKTPSWWKPMPKNMNLEDFYARLSLGARAIGGVRAAKLSWRKEMLAVISRDTRNVVKFPREISNVPSRDSFRNSDELLNQIYQSLCKLSI